MTRPGRTARIPAARPSRPRSPSRPAARLYFPLDGANFEALGPGPQLYVADTMNNRIRVIPLHLPGTSWASGTAIFNLIDSTPPYDVAPAG